MLGDGFKKRLRKYKRDLLRPLGWNGMSLHVLAYNMKRVLSIVKIEKLMKAMRT
jgi:hypothetical protein